MRGWFKKLAQGVSINPDKPLHSHFLFWLPILIFIPLAIVLLFPAWCLCWPSPDKYSAIVEFLRLPTFVASLAIPFTVAIGRFHGSAQRAKSNQLTEKNMTFNHYFDHRGHFYQFLEKIKLPEPYNHFVTISEPSILYELTFPLNSLEKQDMSFDVLTTYGLIANKIKDISDLTRPMMQHVDDGAEPFEMITANFYLNKIGKQFGLTFSEKIVKYVMPIGVPNHGVLQLCLDAIDTVLMESFKFSHHASSLWTPPPLIASLESKSGDMTKFKAFTDKLNEVALYEANDELFE